MLCRIDCSSLIKLLVTILFAFVNAQHDPHWRNDHNTIVHLFEWKWNDIAQECVEFLAPHGYAGVQVSPVTENVVVDNNPWWERYQPVSYIINTRSGDQEEFANMVQRCNDVGVRIYVDVIFNHMAADQGKLAHGTAGSTAESHRKYFPAVPYAEKDFHQTCSINDWNNRYEVQNCELVGLKDLDQSSEWVRARIVEYLNHLIALGVAGFRVDAAKHMNANDLKVIYSRVRDLNTDHGFPPHSRPFIYQEVIDNGGYETISKYEYNQLGVVTEFAFSHEIGNAFRGYNQLKWLRSWGEAWGFLPSKDALVFVDNHDNQRDGGVILTYKTSKQYKMATAFALAHPYGITSIMSSFDFTVRDQPAPANSDGSILSPIFTEDGACSNGWICEHRWRQIYNMIEFKNIVQGTGVNDWWDNGDNQIAFCRGDRGFIAFNGNQNDLRQHLQTCLPPGIYCDIISGGKMNDSCTGKTIQVDVGGLALIEIAANEFDGVAAIHRNSKL